MRHVVKDHHRMAWLRDLLYSRHLLTKGYSRTYLIVKHVLRYVLHTDTCNAHTIVHVRFITSKVLLYLLVYVFIVQPYMVCALVYVSQRMEIQMQL